MVKDEALGSEDRSMDSAYTTDYLGDLHWVIFWDSTSS
jgi:hypothetical protein